MRVKVGETRLTLAHKRAVSRVLASNQISPGPVCREFEKKFATAHGAKYGLFVNSGTDALRIAILALKEKYAWKDGSGVMVPASTFVATANVVLQAGLKVVPIDVSMYDSNLNPDTVRHYLTCAPIKPVAMVPVHLFGKLADMRVLMELARQYRLKVIEDSCESMGVGTLKGDVACYSGYVCHLINTGVGGLSITNDPELADIMRSLANHGRDYSHIPGFRQGKIENRFKFDRVGYSARGTEMQAAMGLVELQNLQANVRKRRRNAQALNDGLSGIGDLILPYTFDDHENAHMMFPVVLSEQSRVNKYKLCQYLEDHGVENRDWLSLDQPCYQDFFDTSNLLISKAFKERGFYIGCHNLMGPKEIKYVVKIFRKFFNKI